jgi:X-X-X-Leu-X-X-Gly heptad repeat protein
MKKLFCIFLIFFSLVGFAEDPPPQLLPEVLNFYVDHFLGGSTTEVFLHNVNLGRTVYETNFNASVSDMPVPRERSAGFNIVAKQLDGTRVLDLADVVVPRSESGASNSGSRMLYNVTPGTYAIYANQNFLTPVGHFQGSSVLTSCPGTSDCLMQDCDLCSHSYCVKHGTHITRCFQCVHRNVHCHCSNSEALLDAWEAVATQTVTCPDCGGQICGLCTHSCHDAFCPNLDSCSPKTCSVCGAQYCGTHVLHFCSTYTELHSNEGGLISSQTSIHGAADVNVNIDTAGLSSAISDLGGKIDQSNQNLNTIISGLNQFHSDYKLGANTLHSDLLGIGSGIGELNTGVGTLNTGVDTLNTGVDTLNTGIDTLNEGIDTLNTELTDIGESLDDQTGILQDIKEALNRGSSVSSGVISGGGFDLPAVTDEYEYEPDLTFFEGLREKLAFPPGYFDISRNDSMCFEIPLDLGVFGFDRDFSFEIDFNDSRIDGVRSVVRSISSFVMVFIFGLNVFRTLSLW